MSTTHNIEQINGSIHYETGASIITEDDGRSSLMAIDTPPLGTFNPSDISAARNHFLHVLRKQEGDRISVLGFRGQIAGRPLVLVVRAS